jgi:hypothetical protein
MHRLKRGAVGRNGTAVIELLGHDDIPNHAAAPPFWRDGRGSALTGFLAV